MFRLLKRMIAAHGGLRGAARVGLARLRSEGLGAVRNRLEIASQYQTEDRPEEICKYVSQVVREGSNRKDREGFVAMSTESIDAAPLAVKAIAFYLPQFHPIPENDEWWGRGFTEWTNVGKAVPQFVGHEQPRLPGELGFYDLRVVDVQRRQIELARQHGLYGFCFYHYWFAGCRLLERPVDQILANADLDFPFCLCWANENWTRRWDGMDSQILIGQNHSPEDDLAFIRDAERYLLDPRYIRVDGKPVLLLYRASLLPDPAATARRWREYWSSQGHGKLHLVAALTFTINDPRPFGFDAAVEFPPHQPGCSPITGSLRFMDPNYAGSIYDYRELAAAYMARSYPEFSAYRTVTPTWDNTARSGARGQLFVNTSPDEYRKWLEFACKQTMALPSTQRFLFINAWNEWAEGAYLEPDRRHGYAYLQETADVLGSFPEVSSGIRDSH